MYSEAVRVIQLDATMPAGYTSIELGCAELAASVLTARPLVYGAVARFDRAVRLDSGYVLRVARVYATGQTEQQSPRRIEVWQGFEDVCAVEAGRAGELDPRRLY